MDLATIIGIISAFALVLISISMGSGLMTFINIPSIIIVMGGTMGATMVQHPMKEIVGVFRVIKHVFFTKAWRSEELVSMFIQLSNKSRKEGILALEEELDNIEDIFFSKGLQLAIDGMEPDAIRDILETELENLEERHRNGAEIMTTMATYFPAMGMIGTLIGLVQMLQTMDDPSTIGPAMALALLTTFYGAVCANLVCIPMAGKLRKRSKEEVSIKEMVICGILAIANGDNPRVIEQKLHAFIAPNIRESSFN